MCQPQPIVDTLAPIPLGAAVVDQTRNIDNVDGIVEHEVRGGWDSLHDCTGHLPSEPPLLVVLPEEGDDNDDPHGAEQCYDCSRYIPESEQVFKSLSSTAAIAVGVTLDHDAAPHHVATDAVRVGHERCPDKQQRECKCDADTSHFEQHLVVGVK